MTNTEELLSRALHAHAERAPYEPTPVGDVAARARGIRRRQVRTTVATTVAVVAAAAVGTTVLLGVDGNDKTDPATPTPSVSIPPQAEDTWVAGLEQGPPPGIDYLEGDVYVSGDQRTTLPLEGVFEATPYRGGYLVLWDSDDESVLGPWMTFLDADLDEVWTRCGGSMAVSRDRQRTGYVSHPCGSPRLTLTVGDTEQDLGNDVTIPGVLGVVGIFDDGRALYATDAGTVASNSIGDPALLPFTYKQNLGDLDEANQVVTVFEGVRGPVSIYPADLETGDPLWQQPELRWGLGRFSPDGTYLTAMSVEGEGHGPYAILDAATGRLITDIDLPDDLQVEDLAWEDDSHLVLSVSEGDTRTLLRVGIDGEITRAGPVTWGEPAFRMTIQP